MATGILLIDDPSALGDDLPVMDVPVFIGLAARGPLQRPVATEDLTQFEAVFGPALELVRRAAPRASERSSENLSGNLFGHLHAAVAGFFANGGRRCHVLRVAARAAGDWVDAGAAAAQGSGAASARLEFAGLRLALRGALAAAGAGPAWTGASETTTTGGSVWRWADTDFILRASSPGSWADRLESAARLRSEALHASDALQTGDLLRASRVAGSGGSAGSGSATPTAQGWLRVDQPASLAQTLQRAAAADWLWPDGGVGGGAGVVDADSWLLERVRIDLGLREVGRATLLREGCGLSAGAGAGAGTGAAAGADTDTGKLPWFEGDADAAYDAADAAARPYRASPWPLAGTPWTTAGFQPASPDWLLLPLGVGPDFAEWRPARLDGRDALARNGVDRFDAALFVDPAWNERMRGQVLRDWADEIRFLGSATRRLQGVHGALGRDDACAREATWIVVPDAAQPGWDRSDPLPGRNGVVRAVADPQCHCLPRDFKNCLPPPPRPPQPPTIDFGSPAPVALPADTDWQLMLAAPAEDENDDDDECDGEPLPPSRLEVQLAGQPDFSDARELINALAPASVTLGLPAGFYFLRARAVRLGLYSAWSPAFSLDLQAIGWQARAPGLMPLHPPADSVCAQVQRALIDLCAASREHFALLAAPPEWDAATLAAHVGGPAGLRAHADRADAGAGGAGDAAASASFAALYHPWVLQRDADGLLREHPPEGLLMGLMARRSRLKGAWSAAGPEPLAGALQVAGMLLDPARIEALGANPLSLRSGVGSHGVCGVCAVRADTLSQDADWQSLGVRRLLILLRRLARREGERFAFESNNLALRRSLERAFEALLQRLMQRGAFRGLDAPSCYLLRTASGAQAALEIERGECSLLIQVAPSRPLRFLTLHLLRAGEQLQIEER